jgi:Fe-S oxidoreductase
VDQALPQRPAVIATACPYCTIMVGDGVAALGQAEAVATRDLAELVLEAMVRS